MVWCAKTWIGTLTLINTSCSEPPFFQASIQGFMVMPSSNFYTFCAVVYSESYMCAWTLTLFRVGRLYLGSWTRSLIPYILYYVLSWLCAKPSLKRAWSGHVNHILVGTNHISYLWSDFGHRYGTSSPACRWQITLQIAVVRVTWPILNFWAPMISLKRLEIESPNFACRKNIWSASLGVTDCLLMGVVRVTWPLKNFGPNGIFGIG